MIEFTVETNYRPYRNGNITKKLEKFLDRYVQCGIFDEAATKPVKKRTKSYKSLKVGKLAIILEFGQEEFKVTKTRIFPHPRIKGEWIKIKKGTSIKIPARKAFRQILENKKYLDEIFNRIAPRMRSLFTAGESKGDSPVKTWKAVAKIAEDITKKSYSSKNFESNSELTQFLKGIDYPLIDNMQLYNSIIAKVKSGSKEAKKLYKQDINKKVKDILGQIRKK